MTGARINVPNDLPFLCRSSPAKLLLTAGRYGLINRGETSPAGVMRNKPSLSPSDGFFVSAVALF